MSHAKVLWPAPANISAIYTTRSSGVSLNPYASNNVALHVEDNPKHVLVNRKQLRKTLALPREPEWLSQIHSTICVVVDEDPNREADSAISRSPGRVLSIMTADCLPILLCNQSGTEIAAIHAGWKGLANGIVENTLSKLQSSPSQLLAWCGPAICQNCYELGEEVYELYLQKYAFASSYFKKQGSKYFANLPLLLSEILRQNGVNQVYQSNLCTFEEENKFYSYRREQKTGRIASLIWFNEG